MPPLDDTSDADLEFSVEGWALVTWRVLSAQVKKDEIEQQCKKFFHIHCHANSKVCSLIIDGGSCTNVASAF